MEIKAKAKQETIGIMVRISRKAKDMLRAEAKRQTKRNKAFVGQNTIIDALIKSYCTTPKK